MAGSKENAFGAGEKYNDSVIAQKKWGWIMTPVMEKRRRESIIAKKRVEIT
jgi:hypothetical protein